MYNIDCSVQTYDWGRIGSNSSVAVFKAAMSTDFKIDANERYAELWMGTHPKGPCRLLKDSGESIPLSSYLKSAQDAAIGQQISTNFYSDKASLMNYGDLPFLFKVLSINKALSIQAHPNRTLAQKLHVNDPKNYPDANHKPEMLVAISETFEAMCGFRPALEISEHFEKYAQLTRLCGENDCREFINVNEKNPDTQEALKVILSKCLRSLMSQDNDSVRKEFQSLSKELEARQELDSIEKLFMRLASEYPNDVGCFVVFLLNCFSLQKGEAIYLAANVPHAYLFGEGVECMACSDNVVRAGLTPKFKDVDTLCSMLDYTMRSADENKLASTRTHLSQDKTYLTEFRPTVDEFSIQQIHITGENKETDFLIPKSNSGSILIVIESETAPGYFITGDCGRQREAKAGLVYFIDANTDIIYKSNGLSNLKSGTRLLAYRAYCDIKA